MIWNKIIKILFLLVIGSFTGCGGSHSVLPQNPPMSPPGIPYVRPIGNNVMDVTIDGSLCGSSEYINEPCTSLKICSPGSKTNCVVVSNILVDTGSFGLRVFSSALSGINLNAVRAANGDPIAECATFGSGSDWGSVQLADVILGDLNIGNEISANIPIQVIDSTYSNFAAHPTLCSNGQVDGSAATAGFNGILGIGVFQEDCGAFCESNPSNGLYFSCTGSTCSGSILPSYNQVVNPIARLPVDNNGSILLFPGVASGGTTTVNGSLVLGIGTRTNNTPSPAVKTFSVNPSNGEFYSYYKNNKYSSIIDSGTNSYSFSDSNIPTCPSSASFYCPGSELALSGIQQSFDGSTSLTIPFLVGNVENFSRSNWVFSDVGTGSSSLFIWGLPFFLGRSVYSGIERTSSSLGFGPYFAY